MSKITYPIICPSCNGTGLVNNVGYSSSAWRVCPACNGHKTIMAEETKDEKTK